MMVDELDIFHDPSPSQVIKGVLDEFGPEGILVTPSEVGEEDTKEDVRGGTRIFGWEILTDRGHEGDTQTEVPCEEVAPKVHPEVEEADEVRPEAERVGESIRLLRL